MHGRFGEQADGRIAEQREQRFHLATLRRSRQQQGAFAADLPHEFGEPRQGAAAEQDPGGQTVVGEIHHAVLPPVVSPGVAGANPSTPARPYCTAAARYLARRLRSASNSRRRCGVVFG